MIDAKTAIIGFIFVCLIFPSIVKSKGQFYMALIAVLLGLLFQAIAIIFSFPGFGFWRLCNVLNILLDIFAILALVLSAGGLTPRQLMSDLSRAYEVMRRGETEKTVIIPLPGQRKPVSAEEEEEPRRYTIEDPTATPKPPENKDQGPGSIPLA